MTRKKRRSFSDTQKADAVRRHLKDGVPVSQIANDLDVQRNRRSRGKRS